MIFKEPLQSGILIKRYKRFLADVQLEDDSVITIYCPNTGSMRSCSTPGNRVCFSTSDNIKRKYPHTLEMIEENTNWVGVNTGLTNQLVVEAIQQGNIPELKEFDSIKQEVKTSKGTRLDILLTREEKKIYIEVKNCSLVEKKIAMFPDAVTARGTKHLLELADLVQKGHRGVIFYLVQRMDAHSFSPAAHIDPLYADTLLEVVRKGVEVLVYQAEVSPNEIKVMGSLPFEMTMASQKARSPSL